MATTATVISYGAYVFNPVPQIGKKSSANPLGSSKLGPADREIVVTLVGRIIGYSYNDIQTKLAALEAAFAMQDQILYWNDGTTTRINNACKVLSIDFPNEWATYEQDFTITLYYIPLDDTNTPPFVVSYGSYTFNPIPIFGRAFKAQRETIDSVRQVNRWTLTLTGYIDKGSITANMTEYNALLAALNVDDTFVYGGFSQAVRMGNFSVVQDTWQRKINYSIEFNYTDLLASGGVITLVSSRSIGRVLQRTVKHYIPFLDDAQIQILGQEGQPITAVGYIIADTMADARTAAAIEIANQFPSAPDGVVLIEEDGSKINEKYTENRVDWNITKFYSAPVLTGGVYGP